MQHVVVAAVSYSDLGAVKDSSWIAKALLGNRQPQILTGPRC